MWVVVVTFFTFLSAVSSEFSLVSDPSGRLGGLVRKVGSTCGRLEGLVRKVGSTSGRLGGLVRKVGSPSGRLGGLVGKVGSPSGRLGGLVRKVGSTCEEFQDIMMVEYWVNVSESSGASSPGLSRITRR